MTNSTIRRVVILGALAICAIIAIQSYWVLRTLDIKEQEFDRSVNIALRKVALQLDKNRNSLPSHNLISRQATNYYLVNINDEINANLLEYYLRRELEAVALNIDFEYGIFDCNSNEMLYGNYINNDPDEPTPDKQRNDLPSYQEFEYYFGVRFPTQQSYLLGSMRLTVTFTAVLFLAVLFFIYSIIVILKQKRLSEMQKDFINNMTHEFKTPISTIKISSDVLLNNEHIREDDRLSRYAQIIKEQNQRLNRQVEKVLQLAKIERDSFKLKLEQIDLHELLQQIVESVEPRLAETQGRLSTSLQATDAIINADRLHLTNILHNLLDNAIKYCKDRPVVQLSTLNQGNKIQLEISDQGIGIAKEHQQKVFNKFYRVSTGDVHNVKGFGLGLYYIKSICEAHDWKILLDSEPGQGTTISISMKRQPVRLWQAWRHFFRNRQAPKHQHS